MKALILNSGVGSRMGVLTSEHPKCMTDISEKDSILSRQLRQLVRAGITEVVMTTGLFDNVLEEYCRELAVPLQYTFVKNPMFRETNYIYSIYCAKECLEDDILLMHGDLVFADDVLNSVLASEKSCMAVSTTCPLPEKDFKAVIHDGKIEKVGIEFFTDAVAAQPLYKLKQADWMIWLKSIIAFCEAGNCKCYAENALNAVSDQCEILPLDVKDKLCNEIDNPDDLAAVSEQVRKLEN